MTDKYEEAWSWIILEVKTLNNGKELFNKKHNGIDINTDNDLFTFGEITKIYNTDKYYWMPFSRCWKNTFIIFFGLVFASDVNSDTVWKNWKF